MGTEIFDHWKGIRKKLIGQQYIEGTWFDIMKLDGQPMDIGISTFEYVDYEIRYKGQDYNLAKGSWAPYHTKMVKLEWPRLTYIYTAQRQDAKTVEMTGYGVLDFHVGTKGPPTTHSGQYLALQSSERISFESFRLNEKKDSNVLAKLVEPTTKRQALFALFEKYGSTVGESLPIGAGGGSRAVQRRDPRYARGRQQETGSTAASPSRAQPHYERTSRT